MGPALDFLIKLENQKKPVVALAGFALMGVISLLDFISGIELAF